MVNGQRSLLNGHWSTITAQWSMVNDHWSRARLHSAPPHRPPRPTLYPVLPVITLPHWHPLPLDTRDRDLSLPAPPLGRPRPFCQPTWCAAPGPPYPRHCPPPTPCADPGYMQARGSEITELRSQYAGNIFQHFSKTCAGCHQLAVQRKAENSGFEKQAVRAAYEEKRVCSSVDVI